jgi:hypothetical protein
LLVGLDAHFSAHLHAQPLLESAMKSKIEAEGLTTYEISSDGLRFHLNLKQLSGGSASLTRPSECLNQLVMTMPRIAVEVLRKRYRDNSLRLISSRRLVRGED